MCLYVYVHVSLCTTFLPRAPRQQKESELLEFEIMSCNVDTGNQYPRRAAMVLTAEQSLWPYVYSF